MSKNPVTSEDVAQIFMFAGLDQASQAAIAATASRRYVRRGENLFSLRDECKHSYYVVDGQLQLSRTSANGDEKVIMLVGKGETFGEALIFSPPIHGYPVNARTLKDTELIAFEIGAMRALLQESTEICFQVMSSMSRRLHELLAQIEDISLHNATYRLVNFLLSQIPNNSNAAQHVQLEVPKLVLASRLSIQPETFSRILSRLRKNDLLEANGNRIILKDVNGLRALL